MPQEEIDRLLRRARRGRAGPSCGSRAATRSCSAAAARRRWCCREAGIPFEVVPGITAGVAAPAYAGIPVTHRELASGVAFVTGHEDPAKPDSALDWPALAALPGHARLLHGRARAAADRRAADGRRARRPTSRSRWSSAARCRASARCSRRWPTSPSARRRRAIRAPASRSSARSPALREQLAWLEARPLHGRTVAVTRARPQASALAGAAARARRRRWSRRRRSARAARRRAARARRATTWCASPRPNGAHELFARLGAAGRDARALAGRTRRGDRARARRARWREHGIRADVVPGARGRRGAGRGARRRRRAPRARRARRARGATCCPTRCARAAPRSTCSRSTRRSPSRSTRRPRAPRRGADYITFTSASTVRFFLAAAGSLDGPRIASIGPATSAALREAGRRARPRGRPAHAGRPRRGARGRRRRSMMRATAVAARA